MGVVKYSLYERERNMDKPIKKKKSGVSYAKWGYIFILPFFITYFIWSFIPQVLTFVYSFFEIYKDGLRQVGPNFCGFDNYVQLFATKLDGVPTIIKYAGNTMIMWIVGAIPQFVVALLLAVWFTSFRLNIKGQAFFKTVIYMPNLIMASAFSMLIWTVFSTTGPVHIILANANIIDKEFDFFFNVVSARGLVAGINFLMWFGNTTILLMAGMMGIDGSLFEAAQVDGATSTQVFFRITLPLLRPILLFVMITSLIGGLQMFDVPQVLTNGKGNPVRMSMTLIMYLNNHLYSKNFGMAGALSVFLFIITGILSLLVYKFSVQDNLDEVKRRDRNKK
jgi:multiple sugar transport system permease protein